MGLLQDLFGGGKQADTPPIIAPNNINMGDLAGDLASYYPAINNNLLSQYFSSAPQVSQFQTNLLRGQAPQYADIYANNYASLLPRLVATRKAAIEQANPTAAAVDQTLGNQVLADLNKGGDLTPEEDFWARQDIRSLQSTLGGGGQDISGLFDESRYLMNTKFARKQARQGAALNYLSGKPSVSAAASESAPGPSAPDVSGLLQQVQPDSILSQALAVRQGNNANIANYNSSILSRYAADPRRTNQNPLQGLLGLFSGLASGGGDWARFGADMAA